MPAEPAPSLLQWTLGFLIVGMAWGLTTPFSPCNPRAAKPQTQALTNRAIQCVKLLLPFTGPSGPG